MSVAGSAIAKESSHIAAQRELAEELGYVYSFEDMRATLTVSFDEGFVDIYIIEENVDINALTLQYEEVQAVRWAKQDEVLSMIDNKSFIPYHKALIEYLFYMRNHKGTHVK